MIEFKKNLFSSVSAHIKPVKKISSFLWIEHSEEMKARIQWQLHSLVKKYFKKGNEKAEKISNLFRT